jgi:hypothetical protein
MLTRRPPPSREDLRAFGRELFGGTLRWLATVLAVVAALFLVCMLAGYLPAEAHWPVRARGTTATMLVLVALIFWSVIAVVNWRSHAGRRHT